MSRFSKVVFPAIVLSMLIAGAFVTEGKAQGVVNDILKRMEAHQQSLQSLQADVEMAATNTQLNITDKRKGEVFYLPSKGRDAYIRINWTKPDEILAVANGKYLLYRPRLNPAIKGKVNGSKNAQASGALAFMSMSRDQLKANYLVSYLGKETLDGTEVWHLGLDPKSKQSFKKAELWVDGNGMPLQAKVVENNNDLTTIRLSGLKKNVKINGSIFAYKPPAGTKIIDG
jgi:outer membrane lipoprotein-sorting protein